MLKQPSHKVSSEALDERSRIDQHQRRRWLVFRLEIDHQQLLMNSHLGSGQADAMGAVHAAAACAETSSRTESSTLPDLLAVCRRVGSPRVRMVRGRVDTCLRYLDATAGLLRWRAHFGEATGQGIT